MPSGATIGEPNLENGERPNLTRNSPFISIDARDFDPAYGQAYESLRGLGRIARSSSPSHRTVPSLEQLSVVLLASRHCQRLPLAQPSPTFTLPLAIVGSLGRVAALVKVTVLSRSRTQVGE